MQIIRTYLSLFFLFFLFDAYSQTIENFSEQDGLSSNYVECVAVDINNNIWFGTANGISIFDGNSWTVINQSTHPNLLSNNIKTITAASNGDIWVGTDYGANKLNSGIIGSSWLSFTTANGLANNKVVSIDEEPNGNIWLSHSSFSAGVSIYDGVSWNSYNSPDLPVSGVCATAFDSNGNVWFASPLDGLAHYDGSTFSHYNTSHGLLSNYSTSICVDNNDNIWLGSGDGMTVINNSLSQFNYHTIMYSLPPPDTLNPVVEIAKDGWGRIWTTIYVGYLAEGGVAFYNGSQWNDFDHSDGLAGPNVKGLAIDNQNNVWVATTTGVSKITPIASGVNIFNDIITIFPNPANDLFHIHGNYDNIYIYDNLGRNYISVKNENNTFDISNLSPGIYYVQIINKEYTYIRSLIVQ